MTVHILRYGKPLCGFSSEVPDNWPDGHLWVSSENKDKATCRDCEDKAIELEEKRKERGEVKA